MPCVPAARASRLARSWCTGMQALLGPVLMYHAVSIKSCVGVHLLLQHTAGLISIICIVASIYCLHLCVSLHLSLAPEGSCNCQLFTVFTGISQLPTTRW